MRSKILAAITATVSLAAVFVLVDVRLPYLAEVKGANQKY